MHDESVTPEAVIVRAAAPVDQDAVEAYNQPSFTSNPEPEATAPAGSGQHEVPLSPLLTAQTMLDWTPPDDDVSEAQSCVTLFERALVAFVRRQLQAMYGDAWLRRGCGKYLEKWREKVDRNKAVDPQSLLGYAELGNLKDIIVERNNWPAFEPYFGTKESVIRALEDGIALRVGSMHPAEREIDLLKQLSALRSMVSLAEEFHLETAQAIARIVAATLIPQPPLDPVPIGTAGEVILSNLGDFATPTLIGRDDELEEIERFWKDPYARIFSIAGQGGVGKTALLDAFTGRLLGAPRPTGGVRPDPEMIVYLTAKNNYLPGMARAPKAKQFDTLQRVLEVALKTAGLELPDSGGLEAARDRVFSLASSSRIMFCLDNLESLWDASDSEYEAIARFLDELPIPSKAVVTTRVDQRFSRRVVLQGLAASDAKTLLLRRIAGHGIEPSDEDMAALDELISYTEGIPLALVFISNHIANGFSIRDTVRELRGKRFIDMLDFSFDSSLRLLGSHDIQALLFLALSGAPRSRDELAQFATDSDELSEVLQRLQSTSFVQRSIEKKDRVRFTVNRLVRDYILRRAKERLTAQEYAFVLNRANAIQAEAESPSVRIEIDKAIQVARELARLDRYKAISMLESTRRDWGDAPRLLEFLGYLYFRVENRVTARSLLEKAISSGYESADVNVYLGLVLYYDHIYDQALERAETALALRTPFPMADQLAGQAIAAKVRRDRLLLPDEAKLKLLQRCAAHLRRSLLGDSRVRADAVQNEKVRLLVDEVGNEIEQLSHALAIPVRGRNIM